jgi:TRAP-type C4-dicarboxylate transport system substrate-binding protein
MVATALSGCSLGGSGADKAGGGREKPATVLKLANYGPSPGELEVYAETVSRASHGSLRVEFLDSWRADDPDYERRTLDDVRAGKADMAAVSARAFDTVGVTEFEPLVAPLAVDSYALQRRVLESDVSERMLREVDRLHMVGVALLPGELRRPLGVSRPLISAGDYRGATIAIRPSALTARTVKALGGSPVPYKRGSEVTRSDGAELGLAAVEGDRLDGPARTLAANVVLWPRPVAIVVNRKVYDGLDDAGREALRTAGRLAVRPMTERLARSDHEVSGVLCRRGQIEFRAATVAQTHSLRNALRPLRRDLANRPALRAATRQIDALRGEVTPEPPPSCEGAPDADSAPAETPIDGVWTMDSTAADLEKIAPGDIQPENWGHVTYVLHGGRFAFTSENRRACIWGYGRYSVEDNTLEVSFTDGGGKAPTDSANRPGERFGFHWSRYRDRLTVTAEKGAISPEGFRVNPWRLQDRPPTIASLSPHCQPPADALQP